MKRTWITESVLCSAKVSAGPVHCDVGAACAETYLRKQLELFSEKFVVCLGNKAKQRLNAAGLEFNFRAGAPGKPGGNSKESKKTWVKLGIEFQKHLKGTLKPKSK